MTEPLTLPALFTEIDWLLAKASAQTAALGRPVTCSKGCFHCCKEPSLTARIEVEYMLESLTPEQRAIVAERTRTWLIQVNASGLLKEATPHVYFWRMMNAWCPLLQDGMCMAYDRRPLSCRTHCVVGDPAHCADNEKRLGQQYMIVPQIAALGTVLMAELPGGDMLDNLGVWLAEILLGKKMHPTAAATQVVLKDDAA